MQNPYIKAFLAPTLVSILILIAIWFYMGVVAFGTAALLIVLEVTLSFDNAVVNAAVLKKMSPEWRHRFLTWGIVFAVFITRAVLPILIVAASVAVSPLVIAHLAYSDPHAYGELLERSSYTINAFGAMFLMMVALKYFFDVDKTRHWIQAIEKHLTVWGSIEAIEIALSLTVLVVSAALLPAHSAEILFAGVIGLVIFIITQGITGMFANVGSVAKAGFALFMYLNVLDMAFSLDSVVGAFALTTNLLVIMVGLGIGAYFVRSLTIAMVEHGTLDTLIYIEHGAHWAILGLAGVMIASLFVTVPEPITGLIGLGFIVFAYLSSTRATAMATHQA